MIILSQEDILKTVVAYEATKNLVEAAVKNRISRKELADALEWEANEVEAVDISALDRAVDRWLTEYEPLANDYDIFERKQVEQEIVSEFLAHIMSRI